MFNPTTLLAEALGRHLAETYDRRFGGREPEYGRILESAGRLVTEWIANSDALYHNTNHTALAALVGEAILRGRLLRQPLEPSMCSRGPVASGLNRPTSKPQIPMLGTGLGIALVWTAIPSW